MIPMSFEGAASFRSRPWLCQALSVLLHAAFFLAGGFLLTVAAEFGVDAGTGGHAPPEPQEMHAEVEIVEYETTPKVLPVGREAERCCHAKLPEWLHVHRFAGSPNLARLERELCM